MTIERAPAMLVLALIVSGCGTLCTATESHCGKLAPFSGTRAAAQGHGTQLDVPFSFIADVILLPITIPKALIEAAGGSERKDDDRHESSRPKP